LVAIEVIKYQMTAIGQGRSFVLLTNSISCQLTADRNRKPFEMFMIIRARHDKDDPYFQLRRATAQDAYLSWAARGVITYLFSKPDNWEVRVDDLVGQGNLGRDAIYKILTELQRSGYIHRHKERRLDGTIGRWVIDVYETPHPEFQELADPLPGLPDLVQPDLAEPDLVNPEHTNKREVQIREFTKKQQQHLRAREQRGDKRAAAAAAIPASAPRNLDKPAPASRFAFDQIEAFIRATKPHKTEAQIGGLARHLQRNGEEDRQIAEWRTAQVRTQARAAHPPDCELCEGTGWQLIAGKGARPCPDLSREPHPPQEQ
jgi:hypothetical protein